MSIDQATFNKLRILHFENYAWVDATILSPSTPPPDFNTRTIYARVSSLSPFAVVQQLAPTAALVSVGGRVTTSKGRGIGKVYVTMIDPEGNSRTALTSTFGYYRFTDVPVGETYVLSVASKRYSFNPSTQIRSIDEEIRDINFVADN